MNFASQDSLFLLSILFWSMLIYDYKINFMKKILLSILSALLVFPLAAYAFNDSIGHLNEEAIDYLEENNVVQGYDDGTYRPNNEINRAEFLKIILESLDIDLDASGYCFPDVQSDWYASYVCKAKNLGIVSGYSDGYFRPANKVNLVEALKIILEAYETSLNYNYSAWYEPYFYFMQDNNLFVSVSSDIAHKITKGEMAQLIYNLDDYYDRIKRVEPPTPKNQVCSNEDCKNENTVDYLIISRPLFEDALQPFVKWKSDNGFKIGFVTVDYVDANYSGHNVAEKIKKLIGEYSSHVDYFLFVGDTEVWKLNSEFKWQVDTDSDILENLDGAYDLDKEWNVPSGYVVLGEQDGEKSMMLSDLYYADLDNWDDDGDGIIDVQPFSEIFSFETMVGRWPVRTPEELENVISKTMDVKVSNMMDFWGSEEWRELYNQEDIDEYCINVSANFLDQGSITIECVMHLIFEYDSNISFTMNYVPLEDISAGNISFADYFLNTESPIFANFHGSLFGIDGLTVNDVDKFTSIIPLYVPQSCSMVHYYLQSADALSEALLKAEKGPATLAVPPNEYFFFKQLVQGKTIGEAFYPKEQKWRLNRWYSMLFGDPSLKIFE